MLVQTRKEGEKEEFPLAEETPPFVGLLESELTEYSE